MNKEVLASTSFFSSSRKSPLIKRWYLSSTTGLLLIATLLLSHQFVGIRHDSILYAGDALARLLPGQFHEDPYFFYGSQGRFTVLPAMYAWLIATFGLGGGTIVAMLTALGLYLVATVYLVNAIAPKPMRVFCILSVVLGWTFYGGLRIFAYSESFFTARSFAEPVVLVGLGALIRARNGIAFGLLAASLLIHPLVGVTGLLAAWLFLVAADRRWLLLGVVVAIVATTLGLAGVAPFDELFKCYDEEWFALVADINAQALVSRWSPFDYGIVLFDATVLWFVASRVERGLVRQLVIAVLAAGLGATIVSLVAVDGLHSTLLGKLQIWRALWILQWTALATLPLAIDALWQRGVHSRVAALFLVLGWMAPFSVAPAFLAILAIAVESLRNRIAISRTTMRIVMAVVLIAAAVIVIQYEARLFKVDEDFAQPLGHLVGQALAMNIVLFGIAVLAMKLAPRLGWAGPLAALGLFCCSLAFWDQRNPWQRKIEAQPLGEHIWPGLVDANAKIYWYRDLMAPWVLLGHGNYYTQQQGSGAVFSREMIVELDKRQKVTGILDFQEQICRMMNSLNGKQGSCEPDANAVKTVCNKGAIDYVVLQSRLEGNEPTARYATGVIENGFEKQFFLYRCSALN